MSDVVIDLHRIAILDVSLGEDTLTVDLSDGRSILAPLAWYPRLWHGTAEERTNWRLIGSGDGIHWSDLDEDISLEALILGKPSSESQTSLGKWLAGRATSST